MQAALCVRLHVRGLLALFARSRALVRSRNKPHEDADRVLSQMNRTGNSLTLARPLCLVYVMTHSRAHIHGPVS